MRSRKFKLLLCRAARIAGPSCLGLAQAPAQPSYAGSNRRPAAGRPRCPVGRDNAWMLVSAALVLLMTGPGLALFYGGLVRKKNILGTMMQSFAMMGLVTILWAVQATRWPSVMATGSLAALSTSSCAASVSPQHRLRRHHSRADLHDLPTHVAIITRRSSPEPLPSA